jgi:hypothetical protein
MCSYAMYSTIIWGNPFPSYQIPLFQFPIVCLSSWPELTGRVELISVYRCVYRIRPFELLRGMFLPAEDYLSDDEMSESDEWSDADYEPPQNVGVVIPQPKLMAPLPEGHEDPCSICLETITKDTSAHLKCNHYFHVQCLSAWLIRNAKCPICRRAVRLLDFEK